MCWFIPSATSLFFFFFVFFFFSRASVPYEDIDFKYIDTKEQSLTQNESRLLNAHIYSLFNKYISSKFPYVDPEDVLNPLLDYVLISPLINENIQRKIIVKSNLETETSNVLTRNELTTEKYHSRRKRSADGNSLGNTISAERNGGQFSTIPQDILADVDGTQEGAPGGNAGAVHPQRQSAPSDAVTQFLMQLLGVPEELHMLTPGLIRRYDYPVEEHFATTPDGYILGLHRIPGPRHSTSSTRPSFNPRVVLLLHCAACSSSDYIVGKPDHSLGFLLADAGYDVWLGNFRGNTYSRNSTKFNPDADPKFWHFSLDEMAGIDIPVTVNFIRRRTRVDKIFYVGHSLGTLAFFMSASTPASIVGKVRLMVAMAPTAFRDNVGGPLAIGMQLTAFFRNWVEGSGFGEMLPRTPLLYSALHFMCNKNSPFTDTCVRIFTAVTGGVNQGHFDKASLPLIMAHLPAGISVRALSHVGQLVTSGGMQRFDYGAALNQRKYGSARPPRYPLSAVTCPTALYFATNDHLSSPKDVTRLAAALPNLVHQKVISQKKFNHMDFLLADSARRLVYEDVLQLMERF